MRVISLPFPRLNQRSLKLNKPLDIKDTDDIEVLSDDMTGALLRKPFVL